MTLELCSFQGLLGRGFMDQIMHTCHWKSHNTFTRFYLKDLAGQDQTEGSYHLGTFISNEVMPPSEAVAGKKEWGHDAGNHIDRVCQNPLTP